MALARDIMRGGQSAQGARAINGQVQGSITAAGTTITDATDLVSSVNVISTVSAATAGVQLPTMDTGDWVIVYNAGANSVKVYPESSTVGINQVTVGSSINLGVNTSCIFVKVSGTQVIANMSA